MAGERWQFTQEDIENTPSRKAGLDFDKELNYRQQAANFLQDMGQRLQVPQLVINTAIVYMHRFYMFHSFTKFHRNSMVAACLFLAAKVEEQPRKLEHVLKVAHMCLHRDQKPLDTKSEVYLEQAQELVINENILLQTLGFDITVDHPHSHVVKTCTLVKATKDLAQTSYFLATNSLHLTNLCLQVNAKVVASVCIHLACKWANWEIPRSSEGKDWYQYVDSSITPDLLEDLTAQFVQILDKCPSKLKKKLMSHRSEDTSHPPPAPEKRQKSEPSAAAGSERSGQSSQSGSSVAASHTHTNHERKERAAQEPPSSSSSSSSKCPNPPSSSQSSRGKSSHTSGANVPESNPGLRRVKTESTALSAKEYMERKQREHLLAQHSKDRHSDAKRHSASAAKPDDRERHHTTSHRALEATRPLIQEQQQAESLSQSSTDGKTSDNIDDAIERSMKEQPHNPNLALSDSSNAVPPNNSIPPEPAPVVKSRSDKRSHDSSRRSHEPKTRHNLEAKHHSKHREDKVNSPSVPPPAESSHKRERKNSSRSSKSPHKAKESRLSFTPEVTASPHSEMKLKIKLGVDPSMSSHKKEKEEKKLKIKSPAPPEKDSRSGSDSEKKDLKLKLNLKNVKPSAAGCDPSAAAAAEPYAPMKLVLSKDKVSGHYSSGHHKHRHSSSHHNSGDKRKRSHSPATTAEGHSSRHSHKMTRTSSASGVQQSGNGHHHGNNANNPSQVNVILQNIDQFIKVRSAEIQKQAQQQLNHNPPLPSDQPDLPPLPPSEPPPQPPLPHH